MGSTSTPLPSSSSAFFVICFFLLTKFILQSAGKQHSARCLPFKCENSNVTYPFYNDTNPMCGFSIINCLHDHQTPVLQMGETSLVVEHIFYNNNTLVVRPFNLPNFTRNLKSENWKHDSCSSDCHNFTIPKTDTISYEVKSPSIVVLVCKRDSLAEIQRGFFKAARNISGVCRDHDIFYRNAGNFNQNFQVPQQCSFLNQCVVVHLPVRERLMANCSDEHLLSLLNSSEFLLQWKLPSGIGEKINWKRKLTIGFSAAGVGILLTCLGFFIYHRYKRQQSASPALLSQDNSSSPSSKIKTDLEKGSTHFGVHIFTYEELEEATDNFHPSKELGDGGFGTVYHGKLQDGREVAVKRLYEHNFKRVEQFMNEVEILNHLRHQNLVTLYGCTSRHSRELLLVYEFIPNGTVADHLHSDRAQPGALKWPIRMNIALQTASALAYLHASDVVHRDVKTNNILLDNNFHVKVADFGLSRLFPMDVTHISTAPQGTPGYLDPDYHQCYQLTEKSDVYSFGVVLVELISSKPAVDITRHRQEINLANMAINRIQNCVLHEFVDPYLGFESDEIIRNKIKLVAELAFRCLQHEKELRPPMYEVFEILVTIECQDGKAEKVDSPKDDIGSLKNIPQMLSPDSVTDKWVSRSTTPNGSS